MALGRSARYYRKNPRSAQKHSDDNNSGKNGKYAHSKAYKRAHYHARKKLMIKGDNVDAGRTASGGWQRESAKANRAKGGRKGAAAKKRNNRS